MSHTYDISENRKRVLIAATFPDAITVFTHPEMPLNIGISSKGEKPFSKTVAPDEGCTLVNLRQWGERNPYCHMHIEVDEATALLVELADALGYTCTPKDDNDD